MKKKRQLLTSLLILPLIFIATLSCKANIYAPQIDQERILAHAPGLSADALKYAIKGYQWALEHNRVNNKNVLTIIDFTKPSDQKRMWVIDLRNSRVLMNLYTTQGKNSGDYYATHFSNRPRSNESSLGVYKTLNTYDGKHGLSERIEGLEPGINSNALNRDIVIHPAWYATSGYVAENHRTGRSWGCFGISPRYSDRFIELTKNGSVLFAYASQERGDHYISHSYW